MADSMPEEARFASPYRGRITLVTGGFGFIGSNLVRRLVDLGAKVRVLARSWPPESAPFDEGPLDRLTFYKGDVRDEAVVDAAVDGSDFVFHLAGKSGASTSNESPIEDLDVNCRGLLILLNALRQRASGATVVFPSSRLVYAPNLQVPVGEDAATHPLSIYGAHKLTGEKYLAVFGREYGLKSVVMRITNPYGPFQRPEQRSYGVINQFIFEAIRGETIRIYGSGSQLRDYVHIDDVVDAFLSAAVSPAAVNRTFNLASGTGISMGELARLIVEIAGSGKVQHVEWPQNEARVETGDFYASISRIAEAIGWRPRVELAVGIRDVVELLRRSPHLRH